MFAKVKSGLKNFRLIRKINRRVKVNRTVGGNVAMSIPLGLVAAFMALPMVYAISNAFKPLNEIFFFPPRFFVRNPTLDNFRDLFIIMSNSWVPFSRYIFNTVFITTAGTTGHVLVASLAAYALAKHNFPGRRFISRIIVLALMFSTAVTAIPNYLIMSRLGWIDTYLSVIVPSFATPVGVFLMRNFFEHAVPDIMLESARMDGAKEFAVFWKIAMPIVKPAWLTLILFTVQGLWSATGGTFIYSEQLKTLPVAFSQIIQGGIARSGVGAAIALLMISVPVIVFIITQSNVIETLATSGIKE
ncbi:MAG TPA: carbohydrate ABC transporter permease [Clostridiaceae bacterium]|nr:carbohydrate ABC transporter permease [Clostridiaceae bacterium]